MPVTMTVCESCVESVREDSMGFDLTDTQIKLVCIRDGYILADHDCENIVGDTDNCGCSAHRY